MKLFRRYPLSTALGVCWTLSSTVLWLLPPGAGLRLLQLTSTTLPHLYAWPLTLPVSGLLVGSDLPVWWCVLPLGTAVVERQVGSRAALGLLAGVHVGATVLSQALLGLQVRLGTQPAAALHQLDVGPSYLAVAGLVAAAVLAEGLPRRVLAVAALSLGLPELLEGVTRLDLAATGHLAALGLALPAALWLRRRARLPQPVAAPG